MNSDRQHPNERSPIEQIVVAQREMARSWAVYAIGCMNRLQSGDLEPSSWLDAYGRYATRTARQVSDTVQALFKLGGGW